MLEALLAKLDYVSITILMTISSSFVPFPSEVVVPPAAYRASQGELSLSLVILCAMIGNLLGALFNYFFAYLLGRALIYKLADTRLARMMFLNSQKIKYYEDSFNKYGNMITLYGRLIPGFRQLISIPAGLAKMKMIPFLIYTAIGSFIWTMTLALLGFYFGENEEKIMLYLKEISVVTIVLVVLFISYMVIKKYIRKS